MDGWVHWTDREDAYLIATYGSVGMRDQAAHLGRTLNAVRSRRSHLLKAGLIPYGDRERTLRRAAELDTLRDVLSQGKTLAAAARKVGIRLTTAYGLASAGGGVRAIRRDSLMAVRTLAQVAALLGVCWDRVADWAATGDLAVRRNGTVRSGGRRIKRHYLVTDDALLAFLGRRELWPQWDVDGISDADWREYARDLRAAAGGSWVRLDVWAQRCYYSPTTVRRWARLGLVPSVKGLHGAWYAWSADLDAFVPPMERPRGEGRHAA